MFLADPQGWKKPPVHPQAEALRAGDLAVVVHSPYVVNLASLNNRIRIPSRKLVTQHAEGAAQVGAIGLVVHGGHVTQGDDEAHGRRQLAQVPLPPGGRGRLRRADPHREHRGRRSRDGPAVRRAGPAVGRGGRVRRGLLPRHLPRVRGGRGPGRRGRAGPRDHRPHRSRAPQRLPRRVRLGARSARQHRRGHHRSRAARRRVRRGGRARGRRDPRRRTGRRYRLPPRAAHGQRRRGRQGVSAGPRRDP